MMQLDQIIIRPAQSELIIQYSDDLRRPNSLVVDTRDNPTVAMLVNDAQQRIPAPQDRPDKPQIEKEIVQLEARIQQLKESIGAA